MNEYITSLFHMYNTYLENIFPDNPYVISVITLAVIGFGGYLVKVIPNNIYHIFLKHFSTIVEIDSKQLAYHNIMKALEKDDIINNSRYLNLLNGRWGWSPLSISIGTGRQFMFIFGRLAIIHITKESLLDTVIYTLQIRTIGRDHDIANKLYSVGNKTHTGKNEIRFLRVREEGFEEVVNRKEDLSSIVLSDDALDKIDKVRHFLDNKDWYERHSIPYHLGILLHGEPGCGKTKFIRVLAGIIGYDVYVVTTLSAMLRVPSNGNILIVMEEVDGIFASREDEDKKKTDNVLLGDVNDMLKPSVTKMLEEMDGVIQYDNRIIIMTTNYPERIDKALLRPGRLDYKIELKHVTKKEFIKFLHLYYNDDFNNIEEGHVSNRLNDIISIDFKINSGITGAMLQLSFREGLTVYEFITKYTDIKIKEEK